jgi:hypothetical protein
MLSKAEESKIQEPKSQNEYLALLTLIKPTIQEPLDSLAK